MKNKFSLLNEWHASWKIVLPFSSFERVLVINLSGSIVRSLARSFQYIDWVVLGNNHVDSCSIGISAVDWGDIHRCYNFLENCRNKYDIIVMPAERTIYASIFEQCRDLLKKNGFFVLLGNFTNSRMIRKNLIINGFPYLNFYSAIPHPHPRIFFPTASQKLCLKGLSFHSPGSNRGRLAMKAIRILILCGLKRPLERQGVLLAGRNSIHNRNDTLSYWLSKQINRTVRDFVIYCGSDSPRRKITALAVASENNEDNHDVVIKIADTADGAEAITQESEALQALNSSELAPYVPQFIFAGNWNKYLIQVQSVVPYGTSQIHKLTNKHYDFLCLLSRLNRKVLPITQVPVWHELMQKITEVDINKLPVSIRECWRKVSHLAERKAQVLVHRTHGDFAPWNIRTVLKNLYVFDWEDSSESGLAFTDAFHFIYRKASLVGPWISPTNLWGQLMEAIKNIVYLADYPIFEYNAALLVWMLQEFFHRPCQHIEKLIHFALRQNLWGKD